MIILLGQFYPRVMFTQLRVSLLQCRDDRFMHEVERIGVM
jgi:hypothetical protein